MREQFLLTSVVVHVGVGVVAMFETWDDLWRNGLYKCRRISMELVASVTFLGIERTSFRVAMFSERGAFSGKLFPREEERSREQPEGALQRGIWTA